ncbi:MAG: hypothetical protein JXR83_12845 [Deltaproteobacteria bacterium]|nr:hypothetical protein [Deltaproteobacteria bacterium]
MAWEPEVWQAFLRAAAYIPPPVRMEAVALVVEHSERLAAKRGSNAVEEQDLMTAASQRVPRAYRQVSLQILEEQGLRLR